MTIGTKLKIDSTVWWRLPQELRFLMAGAYNTAFGYGTFTLAFMILHTRIHYLFIALLCQPFSLTSAFIVHRTLVFKSQQRWQESFARFNLSQLVALLFGIAGLYSLVRFVHLSPLAAQALVVFASVILSFSLHRHFTFRTPTGAGTLPGARERSGGTP
jgi:putative flippase GtrA